MLEGGCESCEKPCAAKVRVAKCGFPSCIVWVHETCATTSQVSLTGHWYCKKHITMIPKENKVENTKEKKEESEHSRKEDYDKFKEPKEVIDPKLDIPIVPIHKEVKQSDSKVNDYEQFPLVSQLEKDKVRDNNVEENDLKRRLKASQSSSEQLVPFNDGRFDNPFANFDCDVCHGEFTTQKKGVLCINCRSTFHEDCLSEVELESKKNSVFVCQYCLSDDIRLGKMENRKKQNNKNAGNIKKTGSIISSTANSLKSKLRNKKKDIALDDSSSSISSDEENDEDLFRRYKELKALIKSRKHKSKRKVSISSDSSDETSDDVEMTQSEAMISLLKSSQEDRNRKKFERLPIVETVDTKWSIFYDLFKESRKFFSNSENVLRIQHSIKCREIIDIGGVNLFDPRAYWQAIKLIDKRLNQSYNLLQKETAEIIKLKKLKYEGDHKKIIEFINKIVNYNAIVAKYGSKKHETDDRVISHIGNIMPNSMLNGWHKLKSKLEEKSSVVSISHISEYLGKQVAYITSKMQAEELDPWKETGYANKPFKRIESYNKRTYNTFSSNKFHSGSTNSQSSTYCWFHKANGHSAFKCYKLWEMSGKEVSDLARKNNICTFCGHMKHKDCPAAKNLNCKIENCNFKHHILFCYKRVGKNKSQDIQRKNYVKRDGSFKNRNAEKTERSQRSFKNPEMNSHHHKDESNEETSPKETDQHEIEIPNSSMYINNPPKTIRVTPNQGNFVVVDQNPNILSYHAGTDTTFAHNNGEKRTTSCILGILVVNFVDSNEKVPLLLDSGSTVSIIEESLADRLEIKGLWHPLRLNWSSDMSRVDYTSRIIKAKVSSTISDSKQYELYFRTVKDLKMHDQQFDAKEIKDLYPHLGPMNLSSYCRVYGIIGLDNLWCFDQQKVFKPKKWDASIPFGIRGPLGDIVMGNLNQLCDIYNYLKENDVNINNHVSTSFSYNCSLTDDEILELA